jgi:hypothetical protein
MSDDIFANLPPKAEKLGAPVAHYRDRPTLARTQAIVGAALRLVLGLAFIGLGVRAYGDPADNPGFGLTALLALSLFAGSFCLVAAARIALSDRHGGNARGVVQCPGGLVCVLPDRCVVAPWDEIESIWDGGRRFRIRGGPEVTLPESLEAWPILAELLYRETFQRMTICTSAVLLGGRPVEFGPVKLTRENVMVGDRRVAWPEVSRVVAAEGRLCIFRPDERLPTLVVSLAEVPNIHALWSVMERLREGGFGSIVIGPGASEPPESE